MGHSDCQILFKAGKALIEQSGLAHYQGRRFVATGNKERFDRYWKGKFHEEFGRYTAWVLFSVGAENLAKAACVCNEILRVDHRPTLGSYTNRHFRELCSRAGLCGDSEERTLTEGHKRLTNVRNRDAHSYHRNARDADFPLVAGAFVPALDILVKAMRHGGHPPAKFQD